MQELISPPEGMTKETLASDALSLLQDLIRIPSFSREENKTAECIRTFLEARGVKTVQIANNICAVNKYYDPAKEDILLNSHHDTVRPNPGYTYDPFNPVVHDNKLFGLGSNDAGGSLVSLISAFLYFYQNKELKYNLVLIASAEEEISGSNGVELALPEFPRIKFGIVGEPTKMQMAVAEKGLLVLDCQSKGRAGHAAREEGVNAIYSAIQDIEKLKACSFDRISDLLGPVKLSVTSLNTRNKAHNVIPDECNFIVDIRVNELYSHEEILAEVSKLVSCEVTPRSFRMRSTSIPMEHPLVKAGLEIGLGYYGSPTTSDKALMKFPALKIGPGDSARSHTADEYIFINEINEGITIYTDLLNRILL